MTSSTMIDLGPGARRLSVLISRVADDQLTGPTPCPAYSLGDLIEHVSGLALAFTAAARKDLGALSNQGPAGDATRLRADWRQRIPLDLETLVRAWREPEAWSGMTRIAGMDAPAEMVGLTVADELAVHGWDVARASDQPYGCEPELLAAAHAFLTQFTSPDAPAGDRVPFGPPRQISADAPLLDRVIALAGRDPGWAPGQHAP